MNLLQRLKAKIVDLAGSRRRGPPESLSSKQEGVNPTCSSIDQTGAVPTTVPGRKKALKCDKPVCRSIVRQTKVKCFFCECCPHLAPQFSYYTCCQSYLCLYCRTKLEADLNPNSNCYLLMGQLRTPCPLCLVPITEVTGITMTTYKKLIG